MMSKKISRIIILGLILLLAAACAGNQGDSQANQPSGSEPTLVVAGEAYTAADLEEMPQVESTFNEVSYIGVPVAELLKAAGYDLNSLQAVKAIASDGYTVNYEISQLAHENVIVAYAQVDGALSADDGDFRMVLPDEEGSMNLRMLMEIQVVE
jgi:hypothetical protein